MTDAERDALDREIAEALEPAPEWASKIGGAASPKGLWIWMIADWADDRQSWWPRGFSRDLNACAVMRARLDEVDLAEEFAAEVYHTRLTADDDSWRSVFEAINISAEQQALAAREVLRGRTDAK